MRDIIEDLNRGKFDEDNGTLDFINSSLELVVNQGEELEGTFVIGATPGTLAEGIVISTDYRMEVLTPQFSGSRDEIAFRFDGKNLSAGTTIKGEFEIISNRGEYKIPFTVLVEAIQLSSSVGEIHSLFHFLTLAKTDWKEAVRLFYDPKFAGIFRGADEGLLTLYRGLSANPGVEENVEEFLLKAGKKQPIEFLVKESELVFEDPTGVSRFQLEITRNGWGFSGLSFSVDGDFLRLGTTETTEDRFLGNLFPLDLYVDEAKLHEGNNFGKVELHYRDTVKVIPVKVCVHGENRKIRAMQRSRKQDIAAIMHLYKDFRSRKINTKTWLDESFELTQNMVARDYYDLVAKLFQAQIMITQQRYNEAKWFLEKLEEALRGLQNEKPELWCYFLYLTTLYSRDEAYVDEQTAVLESFMERYPTKWQIAWFLSFMSPEYTRSMTKKWMMLENQYKLGCTSPVLYIEACHLLTANPSLLVKLESYELQVIRYAIRNDLVGHQLMLQVLYLADREKEYDPGLLRILQELYQKTPDNDLLLAICVQLIRGELIGPNYFEWYQKGVNEQLRITKLYECYMLSLDTNTEQTLPTSVLLYFSYHSDLDYERNAYLFAYVTRHREDDPDMYTRYAIQIREFVLEQLALEHINHSIAYLYREILTPELLDQTNAGHLANVLFCRRVDVHEGEFKKAVVVYPDAKNQLLFSVTKGQDVVIPVYSEDGLIFLEKENGVRLAVDMEKDALALMVPGKLLSLISPILDDHIGLNALYALKHRGNREITAVNMDKFASLEASDQISNSLKQSFFLPLVKRYYDADRMEELDEILQHMDPDEVEVGERNSFLEFLMRLARYRQAYSLIRHWGPECLSEEQALELATGMLTELDSEQRDQEQVLLCQLIWKPLAKGRSSVPVLEYLLENFNGHSRRMMTVYREAEQLRLDTRDICRRMLIRMLSTGGYLLGDVEVLKSYIRGEVEPKLMQAILNRYGYDAFVRQRVLDDDIYSVMTDALEVGLELHPVCRYSYVRHFAANKKLITERVEIYLKVFLTEMIEQGIVLKCFRDFEGFLPEMAWFQDQTVIEYHAHPGHSATIHYILEQEETENSEYISEPMKELFGGVCTKVFVLFFGEKLQYYITEEENGAQQLTESGTITRNDIGQDSRENRFSILNDIMVGKTLHDYDSVDRLMEEYFRKQYLTERLFRMI